MATSRTNISEQDIQFLDRHYAKVGDVQELEGRFDTELKHLATKSDLQAMMLKTTGIFAAIVAALLAVFEYFIK